MNCALFVCIVICELRTHCSQCGSWWKVRRDFGFDSCKRQSFVALNMPLSVRVHNSQRKAFGFTKQPFGEHSASLFRISEKRKIVSRLNDRMRAPFFAHIRGHGARTRMRSSRSFDHFAPHYTCQQRTVPPLRNISSRIHHLDGFTIIKTTSNNYSRSSGHYSFWLFPRRMAYACVLVSVRAFVSTALSCSVFVWGVPGVTYRFRFMFTFDVSCRKKMAPV